MQGRSLARTLIVLATASAFAVVGSVSPAAAAGMTVADWQMNEPPGARTMQDSSGSGLSGTIGTAIRTGVVVGGATGYSFPGQNQDGVRPERLVTVYGSALNPWTAGFAVTVRFYTGAGTQNIVQKGQSGTAGGFFKVDMDQGRAFCTFRGSEGQRGIGSSQTLWDHSWHTVRCERRSTGVTITVDGGAPRTTTGPTGSIGNGSALTIGGKASCSPPQVGCDYFVGGIDGVRVEKLF